MLRKYPAIIPTISDQSPLNSSTYNASNYTMCVYKEIINNQAIIARVYSKYNKIDDFANSIYAIIIGSESAKEDYSFLKVLGYCFLEDSFILMTEYIFYTLPTVLDHWKEMKFKLPYEVLIMCIKRLLKTFMLLESYKISHSNITLDNILVDESSNFKLIGFSKANIFEDDIQLKQHIREDIIALGIVIYEIRTYENFKYEGITAYGSFNYVESISHCNMIRDKLNKIEDSDIKILLEVMLFQQSNNLSFKYLYEEMTKNDRQSSH